MTSDLHRMYAIGLMAFIIFLSTLVSLPVLPRLSTELGAETYQIPIVVSAALATVVVAQFFAGSCGSLLTAASHSGRHGPRFSFIFIALLLGVAALGMTGEMAYPLLLAVLPAFLALFVTFAFLRESHIPKQLKKTT